MNFRTEYITEEGIEYEVRIWDDMQREWYLNGQCHREHGEAIVRPDGYRAWCRNGRYHREDGPAAEYVTGTKDWYWHGIFLTEEVEDQGIDQLSPEEIKFWLPILAAQKSEMIS